MLNCFTVEEQIRERQANVYRERHAPSRGPDRRRRHPTAVRKQLGWGLVEVGLRLALAEETGYHAEPTVPAQRKRGW